MENQGNVYNVGEPTEKITLHISCRKLADLDIITVSDPVCHVYVADSEQPQNWRLYGKTEQIENNLDPDFVTYFEMDYYFEKEQPVKVEVFDVDPLQLEKIGDFETTIGAVMGSINTTLVGELTLPKSKKQKSRGKIILRAEKMDNSNDMIYFGARIKDLVSNKGWCWGSNDPFIYIERARKENKDEFLKVIQTEPIRGNLSPYWPQLKYAAREICNGDLDCHLKFKIYSWRNSGYHKFFGEFETTINQINEGTKVFKMYQGGNEWPSTFTFENFHIVERPSFFDFLHSGWKINLVVAIDFTASNGEVFDPNSLHYLNPRGKLNDYQTAIKQVGNILELYDYNRKYPCLGFGGIPRYAGLNTISHWFHLNGQEDPEVEGVDGIMDAYQFSLLNWGLYGPTFFGPWIRNTVDYVKQRMDETMYTVLLILTDGDIHDMPLTKDIVVEGSDYPLSIIIVGLGENSFEKMIELDSDDILLRDKHGKAWKRDIVQFVKFNEFRNLSRQALAEEVLEEVPEQVISYLVQNNIKLQKLG